MSMGGKAMLPTLGQAAEVAIQHFYRAGAAGAAALDRLVVRKIWNPSSSSIFVGDVVAFTNPLE
eukprot:scaffold158406_cov41-Prasinocladus_malaysianus.AAC.1